MDLLKPFGEIDVLSLYGRIAPYLRDFLKGKEIASKTYVPKAKVPYFLNRAGKLGELWIEDFDYIDEEFLKLRARYHLSEVKNRLNERQVLLWRYFVPRKYSEFFYATNGEGEGKPIERIFIDIDRTNMPAEKSLEVTRLLIEIMEEQRRTDNEFNELVESIAVYWTGSSFHVYCFLSRPQPPEFYEEKVQYHSKGALFKSWTDVWVRQIKQKVSFKVAGGHEKKEDHIIIDPSQTPSGKLARVPLGCLHMKDFEPDGVSVPLSESMLYDDGIVEWLRSLTPEYVVKHAESFAGYLWGL
ncbi:hypothetical protein [Archaeoglobus veneficus]|uniref:DNA primase small subunit PriS n=1 Tax=Archaeoglobus veneficus (strain DSM 11195 / SNP6) TaxID=693661 RepID=F2KS17_ARCVS|nr:hypothetical protein [Archaeoglobus veneficus]AEA46858.1 hypothetical protein Arcve_0844 [Archaeoglobus veneficus SNP6]